MGVLSGRNTLKALQLIRNRVPETAYRLRDDFLTPLLPGAVNGTDAEPGPGTRIVTDAGTVLSITSGNVSVINGVAIISPGSLARAPGLLFINRSVLMTSGIALYVGYSIGPTNSWNTFVFGAGATLIYAYDNGGFGLLQVGTKTASDSVDTCVITRSSGSFYLAKSYDIWGDRNWRILYFNDHSNYTPVYSTAVWQANSSGSCSEVAVPKKLWLPAPLLSDGFAAANEPDAIDYGGVNDGDYVRVGLGGDDRKAFFDGTNSYCDIYSPDVNNKFNGDEGTVIIRSKVSGAGVWTNGFDQYGLSLFADGNNYLYLYVDSANNQYRFRRNGTGVLLQHIVTPYSNVNWFTAGLTFSDSADEQRAFIDGVQQGATLNGLGAFVGNLSINNTAIGALNITPNLPWDGWLSDMILLYGIVASPTQMATIHGHLDVGTLTEQILDMEFGVNNWSWWKLNESFSSDGEGHAEGIAGGIGSGGGGLLYEEPWGAWDYLSNQFHASFVENTPIHGGPRAFAVVNCKSEDVIITADLQAAGSGLVARYVDEDNCLRVYHDGANCVLQQVVNGVAALLISVIVAFGAGQPVRLILDGVNARLYYNDVLMGTTAGINATLISTRHGVSSSVVNGTIDNLMIYARGTDGEYALLEEF